MKKLFVLIVLLCLLLPSAAFANGGVVTRHWANWLDFSSTGWAGWSCPTGTNVVGGGYISEPAGATVLISQAAKPGVGTYPTYPHYTYTPPEEGWVVQNDKTPSRMRIYVDCKEPYRLCSETDRALDEVECSEWSEFVWDAARDLFVSTRTCTVYIVRVDAYDKEYVCSRVPKKPTTEERTRGPGEVIVGVSLRCGAEDSEGTCWQLMGGVTVDPAGGAILTLDGINYTTSQGLHTDFGSHEWSAAASESFTILGDDHGIITITESDCNVPGAPGVHISTGPSGQPINLPLVILIGLIGVSALSAGAFVVKRSRL